MRAMLIFVRAWVGVDDCCKVCGGQETIRFGQEQGRQHDFLAREDFYVKLEACIARSKPKSSITRFINVG